MCMIYEIEGDYDDDGGEDDGNNNNNNNNDDNNNNITLKCFAVLR